MSYDAGALRLEYLLSVALGHGPEIVIPTGGVVAGLFERAVILGAYVGGKKLEAAMPGIAALCAGGLRSGRESSACERIAQKTAPSISNVAHRNELYKSGAGEPLLDDQARGLRLIRGIRNRLGRGRLTRHFARVLEEHVERLLRADVVGNASERAVLLQLFARGGNRFALLARDALHFVVDLVLGRVNRLALGDLVEQQRRLDVTRGFYALRRFQLVPVQLQLRYVDAARSPALNLVLQYALDLPFDVDFGDRKLVRLHQPVEQFFFGPALRRKLAFVENRFPYGVAQLFQRVVIAQIAGEIVVHFRQFLAADGLQPHAEAHRFSGQRLAVVIRRILDLELFLLVGRHAAQRFAELRQRFRIANVQRQLVLVHGRLHARNAVERYDAPVAVFHRPRVDRHQLRLLLAKLFDAFIDVFVGDHRLSVVNRDAAIFVQRNFGSDLELR